MGTNNHALQNQKSIFDIMRKRPARKAEDILSDINKFLQNSINKNMETKNNFSDLETLEESSSDDEEDCFDFYKLEEEENNSYIDIFTNDKNFMVGEDGWIDFVDEKDSKNELLNQMFQNVGKCFKRNSI